MKQKDEIAKMKEINYKSYKQQNQKKTSFNGTYPGISCNCCRCKCKPYKQYRKTAIAKVSLNTLVYICKAMNTTLDYVVSEEYSSDNESLDQQIILELKKM